jgi:hypothetical protein
MCLEIGRKQRRLRRHVANIHRWSNEAERREASIDLAKQEAKELIKRILDLRVERNRDRRDVTNGRATRKTSIV